MWLCPVKKTNSSDHFFFSTPIYSDVYSSYSPAQKVKLNIFDWKLFKSWYIVRCMQLWLHATAPPARLTVCYLITYSKFRFWPFLARNASETPRDRWHCAPNAGLPACIAVLLWGKRSGYPSFITCRHFPGVSNGRHQKPYLSRSSIWLGSHLPGAGYMRAESYGSQDKDHAGGFEQGFICRMWVFCPDGPCLQKI